VTGPRRILVLDDNVDAAQTLGNLLGMAGHTVQLAHSGREAIDLAARFLPDLCFLDIGLPDMSGYDVARALRAQPALRATWLVALTGWGAAADRLKSKDAGIDLHLTKPVSLDALAAALPGLALPVRQGA
jgi:CheY-like chemotaxis protein